MVEERRSIFDTKGPHHKDLPILRQKIKEKRKQCDVGVQKLTNLLEKKKSKFKPEELQSKQNSLKKLEDNVKIIGDLSNDLNKQINRAMRGVDQYDVAPADDIEAQMVLKKNGGGKLLKSGATFEGFHSVHDNVNDRPERELSEFER